MAGELLFLHAQAMFLYGADAGHANPTFGRKEKAPGASCHRRKRPAPRSFRSSFSPRPRHWRCVTV